MMAAIGSGGYGNCKRCGEFGYQPDHECKPAWRAWSPEWGEDFEDASVVYADGAEDAAVAWATLYDQEYGEYDIAHGDEVRVLVVPEGSTDARPASFMVEGEFAPRYRATPIEEGDDVHDE